ncbi:unnamed protein product [Toxocara canis]|uniref:Peptidase_M24 domain-containing protein n=1 Tax=Toxocara canis TaxID=6265 RepID=A0A183TZ72_TOXCA|nr:unnamed protein product [Toxocara canis]
MQVFSFKVNTDELYPIMANLRVFKTDSELEVMRYACKVTSEAHRAAMMVIKPGMFEYQLESVLRHSCYFYGGCRRMSYTPIVASGPNCAVLDYGQANAPNDRQIMDGDMCLFDVACEYNCYASDLTATFPANGKFTDKQKVIYNAVLRANHEVFDNAKPGVWWKDMHLLAERVILSDLKSAEILKGDIDEMMNVRLAAVFMPHGLGHFVGLDVHDVGGYLGDAVPRSDEPGLRSLRTTRTLQERMVITIEPGCYFVDVLLDAALAAPEKSKFFNVEKLNEYRGFGGVRIEDTVVIWAKGNERLTDVPRTVNEIEVFMRTHANQ